MQIPRPLLITALVAAAIGCGGSDDSTPGDTAPATVGEEAGDSSPDGTSPATVVDEVDDTSSSDTSMVALLERVPLAALDDQGEGASESVQISMGDTLAAAELAGLPRPDLADRDASVDWYIALANAESIEQGGTGYSFSGPDFPNFPAAIGAVAEIEQELGFTPFDVDSFVSFSALPLQMAVLAGDLTLSDGLIESGDGILSAGEGDDFETVIDTLTMLRPLGRPHRIAQSDDLVAISMSTPLIEDWLAGGESIATDPDVAAAAGPLDAGGSVAATIVMSPFASFDAAGALPSPIAAPFSTVGIGTAEVAGAPGNVIVYVFADAAAAAASLPVIETGWRDGDLVSRDAPISDFLTVVSVEQDDRAVVVTTNVTDISTTRTPLEMLIRAEPLFTHSG